MALRSSAALTAMLTMVLALADRADAAPHTLQAELDQQRAVWEDTELIDYSYQMQRDSTAPGLVVVSNRTIHRVEDEAGLPLDAKLYLTIDGLFDVVQGAIDADPLLVSVSYDEERGFPVFIVILYSLDDQVSYTAGSVTTGTELAQTEFDAARTLFQSFGFEDYDYVMQRDCFCFPEYIAPGRVRVRDSLLVGAEDPITSEALEPSLYLTLEQLFDLIQDAIDQDAVHIGIQYDEDRGFPELISIDYIEALIDEEIYFFISEFVPEPASRALQLAAIGVVAVLARARRTRE